MGYNLINRIAVLKKQADENREGMWSLAPSVFLVVLFLCIFCSVILPHGDYSAESGDKELSTWHNAIQNQFNERFKWLQDSPIVLVSGAAEAYGRFAEMVVDTFPTQDKNENNESEEFTIDIGSIWIGFNRMLAGMCLRVGFITIAFWPLWILALLGGTYALKSRFGVRRSDDLLGVCDRGKGPFYSGIYGPLQPNNGTSGTDLSCPSLACPPMENRQSALTSKLCLLLKEYSASNETNIDLVRVILAHAEFPSFVGEETPTHEDHEVIDDMDEARVSQTGFFSNEAGTLKDGATEYLVSLLEAHKKIRTYVESLEKKGVKSAALTKNYPAHLSNMKKLTAAMSPLAKLLTISLTPNRLWALGHVEPTVLASAYLAIEAGKCLVYKRHEKGFVRISNYPHLQARAILQSIPSYHREYNGDIRLNVRQAVLSSRRHGDFGRAFVPVRMLPESRAIRDWLEILFTEPDNRIEAAYLVELDGHIEEISVSWRAGLGGRLRKENSEKALDEPLAHTVTAAPYNFWKGLVFKSVVLMPLKELLEIALEGQHDARLKRISQLFELTRKHQTKITLSARLPGFKRQAMEAEKSGESSDAIVQKLTSKEGGEELVERWRIVRRMLTRYNWLSTRVGDEAVPIIGLVQGIVQNRFGMDSDRRMHAFDTLVPLRQRRFVELLGKQWEKVNYRDTPPPEDISVFVTTEAYEEALRSGPHAPSRIENVPVPSSDSKSAAHGGS